MIEWFKATREAVGPDIDLLHDAALCHYSFEEAFRIGRVLDGFAFGWFEEPLADRDQIGLQRLRTELDIPIVALESLIHDIDLSAVWLISGATDSLRVNARYDITSLLKLAYLAELHSARVEMNGPGGLFGLVHAHLMCAISNTSYYEYFSNGSRDIIGQEIGLLNPPVPEEGYVVPPSTTGWRAAWDWSYFEKRCVAEL